MTFNPTRRFRLLLLGGLFVAAVAGTVTWEVVRVHRIGMLKATGCTLGGWTGLWPSWANEDGTPWLATPMYLAKYDLSALNHDPQLLAALGGLTRLRNVHLGDPVTLPTPQPLSAALIRVLTGHRTLQHMTLMNVSLDAEGWGMLAASSTTSLVCEAVLLNEDAWTALSRMTLLEKLVISRVRGEAPSTTFVDSGLARLGSLPRLADLTILCSQTCGLSATSVPHLQALPALKNLDLRLPGPTPGLSEEALKTALPGVEVRVDIVGPIYSRDPFAPAVPVDPFASPPSTPAASAVAAPVVVDPFTLQPVPGPDGGAAPRVAR